MKRIECLLLPMVLACALLALDIGCSTTSLSTGQRSPMLIQGMPYYLPIGKITLKGEYTQLKAQTAAATIASLSQAGNSSPTPAPTSTAKPTDSSSKTGTDTTTSNTVTIAAAGWTITLTAEVEADKARYAVPKRNYIFDDETRVTVNGKHLLSVGNATAEDKSASIVGAIASMVVQGGVFALDATKDTVHQPFYFSFHPSSKRETAFVEDLVRQRHIWLHVSTEPVEDAKDKKPADTTIEEHGLAFRMAIPYEVTLKYPYDTSAVISYHHQFVLPDVSKTYVLDYARMPFVKKTTEVGFTDGMLTDFHQTLPSPVLGFIGIPKAILDAIIPLPTSVKSGGTGSKSSTSSP